MRTTLLALSLFLVYALSFAQQNEIIYDEAKVPSFVLPSLLIGENGQKVTTSEEWEKECRPEILSILTDQMYGTTPDTKIDVRYEVLNLRSDALNGKATRKQVKVIFYQDFIERDITLLIYLPNHVKGKVPMFFSCNFSGNQTVHYDQDIIPYTKDGKEPANRATPESAWPVEKIIAAGYGLATFCYQDVFPDRPDGHKASIQYLFGYRSNDDITANSGQAIASWAWGMSRIMDYFETDSRIDATKVALMGHSRIGKATLWAGVQDTRFAILISNNSGCGGAALSKRKYGETLGVITTKFPHWFCNNLKQYANNEEALAFDQHELLALVAPRPLYVASAEEDRWADPRGEYLSAYYASEVYKLYGMKGLESKDMPAIHQPVMNRVGYHIRAGKHAVTDYDWEQYIRFADKWLK